MPQSPTPQMLDVAGGTLAYDDAGHGSPIVLLHEGIADRRVWNREFPLLARDHRVVRYDLRGFGGSPAATGAYSDLRDLHTLIDRLKLERPMLVGPSMSGRIVIDYALAHPGTIRALLLIAPAVSGLTPDLFPDAKEALEHDDRESQAAVKAWKEGDLEGGTEILRRLWCAALEGEALALFRQMVKENAVEVFDSRSERLEDSGVAPAAPRLATLTVPTEVLVGDRDNPFSAHIAAFIARGVPGSRLTRVRGADHLLNLSTPDAFDRALTGLLERSGPR